MSVLCKKIFLSKFTKEGQFVCVLHIGQFSSYEEMCEVAVDTAMTGFKMCISHSLPTMGILHTYRLVGDKLVINIDHKQF